MLGRAIVEREQRLTVLAQAGRGLVVLGAVLADEAFEGGFGRGAVLGLVDGVQVLLGFAVHRLRQNVQDVGGLVHDPNAIDAVRFTVALPFAGAGRAVRRRRRDAKFP